MTSSNIEEVITQAKKLVCEYMEGYAENVDTRFNAYLDNAQKDAGISYLKDQLDKAQRKFSLVLQNFPGRLVSEDVLKDHVIDDDYFDQWYEALKFIEADKSFSPAFTFNLEFEFDIFEQERREYEGNPDFSPTDNSLFFSEVPIIVVSYYLFRQGQIKYLETKIREADSGRPGPGLNCPFTKEQKEKLYEGCLEQELIAPDRGKTNFIKVLSPDEYPTEKIRWIDVNRDGRLKNISLACFYYTVVPSSKDDAENYTIDRPAIKRCFADQDGNDFELKTPKKTDPSFDRWMRKFKGMLDDKNTRPPSK